MNRSLIIPVSISLALSMAACGSKNETDTAGAASLDAVQFAQSRTVDFDHLQADEVTPPADADSVAEADSRQSIPDAITERPDIKTPADARRIMNSSVDSAKYAQGILHRMAADNLSYTSRLLNNPMDHFVVVDKSSMYVVLFDRYGRVQKSYKMACARNYGSKHARGDCRTPEGFFSAEGIYDSTDWLYTDDNGYTSPTRGVYGPRFIRVKNPATNSVGIHGTNAPGSLGRRASHGCVRLRNSDIVDLVKYVRPGMTIIVNPSDRDQQVNRNEGRTIAKIDLGSSFKTVAESRPIADEHQRADTTVVAEPHHTDTTVAAPADTVAAPAPADTAAAMP